MWLDQYIKPKIINNHIIAKILLAIKYINIELIKDILNTIANLIKLYFIVLYSWSLFFSLKDVIIFKVDRVQTIMNSITNTKNTDLTNKKYIK